MRILHRGKVLLVAKQHRDYPLSVAAEEISKRLQQLPSVEQLAATLRGSRNVAVRAARKEIDSLRERILAGEEIEPVHLVVQEAAVKCARLMSEPQPRPVINATGVVLHTNLGRAPLADEAIEALVRVSRSYSDLEFDLESGGRGARGSDIELLICELTGAEAALAVNNNAAALLLALSAVAAGAEVVVSRGQLIEIGGGFRIPDVLAQSGARLVEVGTTNRTRIEDYEAAITPHTAAILRVHQSNFRTVGFAEEAELGELANLAKERGLALVDDLGSGALRDYPAILATEPSPITSVAAGADLVCFSGDKLLGGPQAGLLVGQSQAIERCGRHPLVRALRLDKLQIAALTATLRLYRDARTTEIPALAMIGASETELHQRAVQMVEVIGDAARIEASHARAGGGTLPLAALDGPVCVVDPGSAGPDQLARALRQGSPHVVARIGDGEVILDPRTMSDEEASNAARAVRKALD